MNGSKARKEPLPDIAFAATLCNRMLNKLRMISEVPAPVVTNADLARRANHRSKKEGVIRSGKLPKRARDAESKIPQGVSLDGPGLSERDRDDSHFSLYAHYQPKVVKEYERQKKLSDDRQDCKRLITLWRLMERDYAVFIGKLGSAKPNNHKDQIGQLFTECIGFNPQDAAEWCEADVAWVVKSRLLDRRDIQTGIKKTRSKQVEEIIDLVSSGMTQEATATELGLSKQYVGQVLKGKHG